MQVGDDLGDDTTADGNILQVRSNGGIATTTICPLEITPCKLVAMDRDCRSRCRVLVASRCLELLDQLLLAHR